MSVPKKFVKVVVLGDIGRSPRMQYHCMSLSERGHQVDVIGYGDTEPMECIKADPQIFYHYLFPVPQFPVRIVHYFVKTIVQSINLLFLLFITAKSDAVVLQNPPAIPAMLVCWIYARAVNAKFVIDWHNYAHTILALSVGEAHPLVRVAKTVETALGRRADFNLCVTNAMKNDLRKRWSIQAVTLYDRPPLIFKPISVEEKHKFLLRCGKTFHTLFLGDDETETVMTKVTEGGIVLKPDRPGLLVSSTSWTQDEDFSLLLTALEEYDRMCQDGNPRNLPQLICVITGKGHMKDYYVDKVAHMSWKNVTIITAWLEAEDYPLLLGSADLGVSLHRSSSGLDLPMKIVDMFGCGLPVCALNFPCLNELVIDGENGFVFSTPQELSRQILNWFEDFPNNKNHQQLEMKFKSALQTFQDLRWRENWNEVAAPIFE